MVVGVVWREQDNGVVYSPGEFTTKLMTMWVIADVSSEQGRNTLLHAIRYLVGIKTCLHIGNV